MSNSFWKINVWRGCDGIVDIGHWEVAPLFFIKYSVFDSIILSVAFPAFEFKSFPFQSIFGVKCLLIWLY